MLAFKSEKSWHPGCADKHGAAQVRVRLEVRKLLAFEFDCLSQM